MRLWRYADDGSLIYMMDLSREIKSISCIFESKGDDERIATARLLVVDSAQARWNDKSEGEI